MKYGDRITELTSTYVSVPILNVVFAPDQLYDVLKKLMGKFCQVREWILYCIIVLLVFIKASWLKYFGHDADSLTMGLERFGDDI